ncbi:MAG: hypothetical protein ACKO38_16410 [Planctomycetota bacterium]
MNTRRPALNPLLLTPFPTACGSESRRRRFSSLLFSSLLFVPLSRVGATWLHGELELGELELGGQAVLGGGFREGILKCERPA